MQLVLDKFGRMVLPKKIRDDFGLRPGDKLDAAERGDEIVLRPRRQGESLAEEDGVLVHVGRSVGNLDHAVENDRGDRIDHLSKGMRHL